MSFIFLFFFSVHLVPVDFTIPELFFIIFMIHISANISVKFYKSKAFKNLKSVKIITYCIE